MCVHKFWFRHYCHRLCACVPKCSFYLKHNVCRTLPVTYKSLIGWVSCYAKIILNQYVFELSYNCIYDKVIYT